MPFLSTSHPRRFLFASNWSLAAGTVAVWAVATVVASPPQVLDDRYRIEPVTDLTEIVTPVGCTHDHRGRLLVIESHTHQRPEGYVGPPHDRIRLIEDTDGDGRADRFRTFHEGTQFTMGLRRGPDDWIYVATRAEVFRIRDSDGDDVADQREPILRLETKEDYPHNGLSGLAFDHKGDLFVGLGENHGVDYTLVGTDGSSWSDEGEGGSVFCCSPAGANLARVATGFWNPFGLVFDPAGRLFAVDNDPNARPPCRLIDVVLTGDYGFRFRYGRSGRHPLQSWDGELPGTLPMAAGTGEAPCNVVPYDGSLWVTSWGHNRLEVYTPTPDGATCRAVSRIVVQGDHEFRPVDLAAAPDGSLLITDWLDRAYPVHGRGRLWRLRIADGSPRIGSEGWPPLSAGEQAARRLATDAGVTTAERQAALQDGNVFMRQAAVAGMVAAEASAVSAWDLRVDGLERLGVLMANRWRDDIGRHGKRPEDREPEGFVVGDREAILAKALADADERIVSFATRWIADERIVSLRPDIERLLAADATAPELVPMLLAALDWLEQPAADPEKKLDIEAAPRRLQAIWQDPRRPVRVRLASLQMSTQLPRGDAMSALATIAGGPGGAEETLAREAVRLLATAPTADVAPTLERIAADATIPAARRADALVGLARLPGGETKIAAYLDDPNAAMSTTARDLVAPDATKTTSRRSLAENGIRPVASDTATWAARLGNGGDPEAGWRLFFGNRRARCGECHQLGGRGASVGPELAGIARRMGRSRVLESILQPAREVGPAFQPCAVTLSDGRVITGISIESNPYDHTERFLQADGKEVTVKLAEMESRTALATSIMPAGLEQALTDDELRNLLAALEQ